MTHTLHRQGSIESLQNDICIMAHPQRGANYDNSKEKLQLFLKTASDCGAENLGMIVCGNMVSEGLETVLERVQDGRGAFTVFSDKDKAAAFVKKAKELDLGISVVITALWDLVKDMCEKAGVKPHSVNRSLGIWGDLEKLPDTKILELTTMCGHAQISNALVRKVVADIKKGRISARDGAIKLAKPCICGFFNPPRAEELLTEAASGE